MRQSRSRRAIARRRSRLASRSAMAWRLSWVLRPLASASSTLARPSLKYTDSGMSDRCSGSTRARSRSISWPWRRSLRLRGSSWPLCVLGVGVDRDGEVVEPDLAAAVDAGEGVADLHLAVADRLHLGAAQHEAGLDRVEDLVVPTRLAVRRHDLGAGLSHGGGHATGTLPPVLHLTRAAWSQMVGHAYDGLPDEACGLLAGPPGTDRATVVLPVPQRGRRRAGCTRSTRKDHLRDRPRRRGRGLEINGVVHSHTHTDAYPSPTDVAAGARPDAGTT